MFGSRLRFLRESEGLTQKELGAKFNTTQSVIGNYEQGKREPNIEMMKKFANYFGVSLDYLLGNSSESEVKEIERLIPLRDELIKLMIQRGIIKTVEELNDEHLNLIEMAIKTYKEK